MAIPLQLSHARPLLGDDPLANRDVTLGLLEVVLDHRALQKGRAGVAWRCLLHEVSEALTHPSSDFHQMLFVVFLGFLQRRKGFLCSRRIKPSATELRNDSHLCGYASMPFPYMPEGYFHLSGAIGHRVSLFRPPTDDRTGGGNLNIRSPMELRPSHGAGVSLLTRLVA